MAPDDALIARPGMTRPEIDASDGADILVVDDTVASLRLLTEMLSEAGYRVRPAERPHAALQSALAHPPSLILLDVRMPEMSGFTLCRRLKQHEQTAEIPVIFVSALQDVEDRVSGFEAGGVDFVSKPFQEAEVLARVKTHLQLRAMQHSLEALVLQRTGELRQANEALRQEVAERRAAEIAALENEEKFRALFDHGGYAMSVATGDSGRIIEANQSWVSLFGFDEAHEVIDQPAMDFVAPHARQRIAGTARSLDAGSPVPMTLMTEGLRKDNSLFYMELGMSVFEIGGERYTVRMINDVTDRVEAEQRLRTSEMRFRATFEQAAVGIAHVAPNGQFLRVNQRFCEIVGYTHEEMLTHTFQDITHRDDLRIDLDAVRQLLSGLTQNYAIEKRYYRKDGVTVWVNLTVSLLRTATGEPDYFVSVIEDITERKRLQEERDHILTLSQDLISIVGMDGLFKYVNPAWESMLGFRRHELIGKRFLNFVHPDDYEESEAEAEKLAAGHLTSNFENRYIHKDGTIRHLLWVATPLVDAQTIYCIARDVTWRKQAEEEALLYQNRLKALAAELTLVEDRERRRIAADLHDEVSQTLAFSRIQLAAARKATSETRRNTLLDETSQTLLKMIQTTRTLVFDLSSPLLNEIGLEAALSEWAQRELEAKHGLITTIMDDREDKPLTADVRGLLYRNTRELLINVFKHANATAVVVRLARVGDTITISVEDDGDGMDPTAALQSVIHAGKFGLFSIQERMSDLGGSLEIVSNPGSGSTVILTAPLTFR